MSNSHRIRPMPHLRHLLPFTLILLALAAPSVQAQTRIQGRVIDDETQAPIAGVSVVVLDGAATLGTRVTDAEGLFEFTHAADGAVQFRASRIGYRETTTPGLWTEQREFILVEIRLDPEAVLLAPIEVVAWSARGSPVLSGFRQRLAAGLGSFFTREDIERLAPMYVTDVIATIAGVRLVSSGTGFRRTIYMSRARGLGGECPAQIFVDGFLFNRRSPLGGDMNFTLDEAVTPGDVEGIEVYRGLSGVPAEFMSPEAHCGVVAVWTRRGD